MSAADRLNEIEARANAATEGPWYRYGTWPYEIYAQSKPYGGPYVASVTGCDGHNESNAEFIARARADVPALVAALRAVLDLHRESRNDVDRTPPCEHCNGEPGVHACGCWADEKWPTVCAVCMEGTKGASVAWPCPTARAIEEALA